MDQVSQAGGQPIAQMFIHEDGEDWDVLLFKPFPKTPVTAAQQAAMDAKADELHLKTGVAFWLEMRQNVASHTETKATGPLSAAQWLATARCVASGTSGGGQGAVRSPVSLRWRSMLLAALYSRGSVLPPASSG